jgi:nicotinamide riboside transporter PnuC
MELLATFGRTLGFSFAAGINLYATVAVLGLASRYEWVALPPQFKLFDNDLVIGAAVVMYLIEFFADKIPIVDTIWDAIHTVIRPVTSLGEASPTVEGLIALLGGTIAAGTHFGKAGTRAAVNTSPEPFSNWILSLGEDVFVVGLGLLALKYPAAAAIVVLLLLALMVVFAAWIVRAVRRRFRRAPAT